MLLGLEPPVRLETLKGSAQEPGFQIVERQP